MSWLPRTLGVLTAAYGLATLVRPAILSGPAGLAQGEPPAPVGILVRAVGVRDIASGVAIAVTSGRAQQVALVARIASDLGDALTWAANPSVESSARTKTIAVGVGWGALNALGLLVARR
jgi:hypothetical protein